MNGGPYTPPVLFSSGMRPPLPRKHHEALPAIRLCYIERVVASYPQRTRPGLQDIESRPTARFESTAALR
jgi:hypothetical protein